MQALCPACQTYSVVFARFPHPSFIGITIEHSVTVANIDGKNVIIADDTVKTKSSYRTLPLVPAIRAKLIAIKEEQERNRRLCGKSYNLKEGCYIYTDALGNRIKPDYLSGEFPKFLEKHGFKRMRFHDRRHSCASLLLANGVPLKSIQEWLGHSDFAITANTYAHLDFNSKIASADKMAWIGKTSLASEVETIEPVTLPSDFMINQESVSSIIALTDFLQSLSVSGIPSEVVQAWLKEADLSGQKNFAESFIKFQNRLSVTSVK